MRSTKSFTLDRDGHEVKFDCTQLGAWEGSKALIRAQKIAVSGVNGLDALIEAMTDADLEYFQKAFAKSTFVTYTNDKEQRVKKNLNDVFDVFFSGHLFEMTQWLVFCLGHNFGNFFLQIQSRGELVKQSWNLGSGKDQSADTAPEPPTDPEL